MQCGLCILFENCNQSKIEQAGYCRGLTQESSRPCPSASKKNPECQYLPLRLYMTWGLLPFGCLVQFLESLRPTQDSRKWQNGGVQAVPFYFFGASCKNLLQELQSLSSGVSGPKTTLGSRINLPVRFMVWL